MLPELHLYVFKRHLGGDFYDPSMKSGTVPTLSDSIVPNLKL